MLIEHTPLPLHQLLPRDRPGGVTLRLLVSLSSAAAAVSLFSLPALTAAQITLTLLCLGTIALSVWCPPGRIAGWLPVVALACCTLAQAVTQSPLLDYVFLALIVYALTTMRALPWALYTVSAYSCWAILHYRSVDDVMRWLQSNLVFALPAAAALGAGFVYRRSLRRLLQYDQLLQQMQQRADGLSSALRDLQLRVAAEERHRLAQQLSDDLQAALSRTEQQFQAALTQLQLNFERAQASLDNARSGVIQALERLRQAVQTLRGSTESSVAPIVTTPTGTGRPPRSVTRRWELLWLLPAAALIAWPLRSLLDSTMTPNRPRLIDDMFSPLSLLGLLAAIGLVLTPLIVARVQLRRARVAEQRLAQLVSEIEAQIAASRAAALNHERTRLARELHDELGSQLVLINLHLQLAAELAHADSRAALQQLEQSRRALQQTWQRLIGLVDSDLTLSAATLPTAVHDLIAAARETTAAPICVTIDAVPSDLHPAAAVCLYRVVQEGLTNALKYAAGAAIHVQLQATAHQLQLTISNGPPHGSATVGGSGFGLIGLRERSSALGATLEAGPDSGGGWRLELQLPHPSAPQP